MLDRLEVRERVLTCEACRLADGCTPVPFVGDTPSEVVVIGESPPLGAEQPFADPAGRWLVSSIVDFVGNVCLMSVVSCAPRVPAGWKRPPCYAEVEACSENLSLQLSLANPKLVVLVGDVALKVFQPSLNIAWARGKPFWGAPDFGGPLFFPVFHQEAGYRNKAWQSTLMDDLGLLPGLLSAARRREDWGGLVPVECVRCGVSEVEAGDVLVTDVGLILCDECR